MSENRFYALVLLGTIALCAVVILTMGYNMNSFKNNVTDQFEIQEEN